MKKYFLIFTSIIMTCLGANEAPSPSIPKLDQFQQISGSLGMAYSAAMNLCNEQGFSHFKFVTISWKGDQGQKMKFKEANEDTNGVVIKDSLKIEGFGKTEFKIIAYKQSPEDLNACDVAAFNKLVEQMQAPAKKVENSEVTELSSYDELGEAIQAEGTVFVDCYGAFCGPCKTFSPEYDQYSIDLSGKGKFYKIEIQNAPEIKMDFGVTAVPTLLIFKDGQLQDSLVGAPAISNYLDTLK